MKVYNFLLRLMGRRKVYTSEEGVHLPPVDVPGMKVVYTYLNQTKSLFGLNQPVHSELNALFMGIKDMDQTLVLLRNQNNDSLLFVQDTLSQIPLQD